MDEERCCARCGQTKRVLEFSLGKPSVCRECERKRLAVWREGNRARFRETKADWQKKNVLKRGAHKAVENAIRKGDLSPAPCERCGDAVGVHAHHDDYSKPLEIMWLCPLHHGERHRELRASARSHEGTAA